MKNTQFLKSGKPEEKQIIIPLLFNMPRKFLLVMNVIFISGDLFSSFKKSTCLFFYFYGTWLLPYSFNSFFCVFKLF